MGSVTEMYENIFGCWSGWVDYCNIRSDPINEALYCVLHNFLITLWTLLLLKKNVHNLSLEPILISHINTKTFRMALTYTEFPQECNYYYISGEKNISSSVRNFRKDELHF